MSYPRTYRDRVANLNQEQARIYDLLHSHLPEWDKLVTGKEQIVAFVHRLGISDGRKRPVKWETLRSWARLYGFPLLPGIQRGTANYSSTTSQHAVVAWVLSRKANGIPMRSFIHLG